MADMPLISIIVPVYNVATCLEKTLESLYNQTYPNVEIILVNDGSTDNSGDICDQWAARDSRFRVIHQENAGPSLARNAALDIAQGEYILLCDSDDLFSPEMCSILYHNLAETDSDIAVCEFTHIFPDTSYDFHITDIRTVLSPAEVVCSMWYQTGFIPSACAKLYRRHVFASHRFTPGLFFEDIDLLHELYYCATRIVYTPSRLYGYVHHSNSITTAPFSKRDLDIFRVCQRHLSFAESHKELRTAAIAYYTAAALRVYLNAPQKPEFAEGLRQAQSILKQYGKDILADPHVRRKNRYALYLYFLCKPLLRFVYKHINRWK